MTPSMTACPPTRTSSLASRAQDVDVRKKCLKYRRFKSNSSTLFCVFPLEPFNAAGGIDEFLLSGKERMTLRTDFEMNFGLGGTGTECFSARTFDHGVDVIRMNVGFHENPPNQCSSNYKGKALSDKLQWLQWIAKS